MISPGCGPFFPIVGKVIGICKAICFGKIPCLADRVVGVFWADSIDWSVQLSGVVVKESWVLEV
jgi:hypothetical protein